MKVLNLRTKSVDESEAITEKRRHYYENKIMGEAHRVESRPL